MTKHSYSIYSILFLLMVLCCLHVQAQTLPEVTRKAKELREGGDIDGGLEMLEPVHKAYGAQQEPNKDFINGSIELALLYTAKWNFKKAERIAWDAAVMSETLGYYEAYYTAMEIALPLFDYHGKTDSTRILSEKMIKMEQTPPYLVAMCHINMAGFYDENEKNDSALYHMQFATEIEKERKDSVTLPYTFFDYANFLMNDNQYEKALEEMLFGMSYLRDEDVFKRISFNVGLSNVYYKIGNVNKSRQLIAEALKYGHENDNHRIMIDAYLQLGAIAEYDNDWDSCLDYYRKADSINQIKSRIIFKGIAAKIGQANAKLKLEEPLSSTEIKELKEIREQVKANKLQNKLDFLFLRLEDFSVSEFEKEYDRLYMQSEEKNADHMKLPLLQLKKDFYAKKKDFKKALLLDSEIKVLRKKIAQANNEYIIQDLDAKYQKEIQDREIIYLNEQKNTQTKVVKQQRNTIIAGALALILGTLLLLMLFRLFRKVIKQKSVIEKAISDKDILIKEIHHRVKNNLQLVSSLLTLQSRGIDDEKAKSAIQEGKNRVRSMALIHQDLYKKEELKAIGVKSYLEKLTHDLFMTYKVDENSIELQMDIEEMDLDVDTIVPLGLIINELITNSLKYAFPNNRKGKLIVVIRKHKHKLELNISDDGVGYLEKDTRSDSFGTTLISALTRQLGGQLKTDSKNGSHTQLVIPLENDY